MDLIETERGMTSMKAMTKSEKVNKGLRQCMMSSNKEEFETQCHDCPYYNADSTVEECVETLKNDTLELLKEHKGQRWISVMEKLPEPYVNVLVAIEGDERVKVSQIWVCGNERLFTEPNVTHWMSLPKTPR